MDRRSLAVAIIICLCFGAIHACGVLLVPIEHWIGISRTQASLVYSSAIVSLTMGVYLAGCLEALLVLQRCLIACGLVAAIGLLLAAMSSNFNGLLVGFSVIYGLVNGVAYSLSLGVAARALAGREGRALGFATAAYGLGAVLFAQIFEVSVQLMDMALLLVLLAAINLVVCLAGAALARNGRRQSLPAMSQGGEGFSRHLLLLWTCYLLGAFSGLMVLAHAPSIAAWYGSNRAGVVAGLVSFGSVAGSYIGGFMAERVSGRVGLSLPLFLQMAAIASVPLGATLPVVIVALVLSGLCYGALTAAVPVEVLRKSGTIGFGRDYGKVVTAWGLAGVAGPVTAGYLYDMTGGYSTSLSVAAVLSAASCLLIIGVRFAPIADNEHA